MNHSLIVGGRVIKQLRRDKRFFAFSIIVPLVIIFFLKLFVDSMSAGFPAARYLMPIAAFIVHFLSFLLCTIVLVQERTAGTLERMFISGFKRTEIIGGYILGYFGLATIQAGIALAEVLLLFRLSYGTETIIILFAVIWLLAIASVMLGIFVSTFARHEGHVFPFIPLIFFPSVFFSGLLIDIDKLPLWAKVIGRLFPLHYAINVIQEIIKPGGSLSNVWVSIVILFVYGIALLFIASLTLREVE